MTNGCTGRSMQPDILHPVNLEPAVLERRHGARRRG